MLWVSWPKKSFRRDHRFGRKHRPRDRPGRRASRREGLRRNRSLVWIKIRPSPERPIIQSQGRNMVRVGLIGFGLAGQAFHAPMIRGVKGMELACVLERKTDNAKKRYPEVRIARNSRRDVVRQNDQPVVVATPNDTHYSYTKACLEAGRHVVVDKPLTPTMAEAEELSASPPNRGLLISVYQDRRWDGAFLTVKKLIQTRCPRKGRRIRNPLRPLSSRRQAWCVARKG